MIHREFTALWFITGTSRAFLCNARRRKEGDIVDIEQLSTLVALLAALSVAAERLVEIVKNWFPASLAEEQKDAEGNVDVGKEGRRKVIVQILAIVASIITVILAWPAIAGSVPGAPSGGWWTSFTGWLTIVAIGILVSGGSGFWNKIVGYVGAVRDLKNGTTEQTEAETEQTQAEQVQQNVQMIATAKDAGLIDPHDAENRVANLLP
jgi:Sec-independent protein translocase protein TatA